MPANGRSLRLTDLWRRRLLELRDHGVRIARREWDLVAVDDIERGHAHWVEVVAPALVTVQAAGVRLTAAYLTAFMRSELGAAVAPPEIDEERYVGVSRSGKALPDALLPPLVTVRAAVAGGVTPEQALELGARHATRLANAETMHAARHALTDTFAADDRISGWRRVTSGASCGACLGASTRTYGKRQPLRIHDNCDCTAEPIIADAPERIRRPDGNDIFSQLTPERQDELLGAQKAQLIRSGEIALSDLVHTSPMHVIADQLTEKPLAALT